MPNWVFSTLTVEGNAPDISDLKAQLNKPFETYYHNLMGTGRVKETQTYSNPVIAFWNIKTPPAEIFDEYFAVEPKVKSETPVSDPNWWADTMAASRVSNHWYDWNNTNWGTKWDIAVQDGDKYHNTQLNTATKTQLSYSFQTAWSPVDELIGYLSTQYPKLTFFYDFEEEQGWGGSVTFKNGEILDQTEYDSPSSHADYMEHGRECICEYEEDVNEWYEDCPIDKDVWSWNETKWVNKKEAGV